MSLTIQGSFEAYVWAVFWQVALACLQSGGRAFNPQASTDSFVVRVQYAASIIANGLSWAVWGLSVWVGVHEGLLAGIVFAAFSFAANALTLIEISRIGRYFMLAQIAGFLAMPLCAFETLNSLGIFNSQ